MSPVASRSSAAPQDHRRLLAAVLAVLMLVVTGFLVVPVSAARAAEPCNPDVANWPDCLPTLAQLRDAVRTSEDGAFFWTGGALEQAGAIATSEGGTTLEQALDARGLALPQMGTRRSEEGDRAWQRASRMLAEQASGIAYVVIGNPPRPNNVWISDEQPALRSNPRVRCIMEITARTGDERLIYARGDDQERARQECEADRAARKARRECRAWEAEGFPHLPPGAHVSIPSPRLLEWRLDNETLTGGARATNSPMQHGTAYRYSVDPSPTPTPTASPAEIDAQVTAGPHMDVSFLSESDRHPYSITVWNPGHTFYRYFPHPDVLGCTPAPRSEVKRDLRVMAAGSSTTYGIHSSDGNGYRRVLDVALEQVVEAKDPDATQGTQGAAGGAGPQKAAADELDTPRVDQVGSVRVGSSGDRDNEGWPRYQINEIAAKAKCAVPVYQPNLVTLLAGGNDVINNYQMGTATSRLEGLVRQIGDDSPAATVLVSSVQRFGDPAMDARGLAFSQTMPAMVDRLVAQGRHVIFVDSQQTPGDVSDDDVHPTDAGYAKLGRAFSAAAASAFDRGWIEPALPQAPDVADNPCGSTDGGTGASGGGAGGAGGSSVDDARWEDHGVSFPAGLGKGNSYRWGHVNGDGRPELFVVEPDQSWTSYWNGGRTDKGWTSWGKGVSRAAPRGGAVGNALRFADIDGDGLTDCVRVDLAGGISVSTWDDTKPVGQKLCGSPWKGTKVADGPVAADTQIVFADVDGDERDDYLLVQPRGTTHLWLNRATGWIEGGQIAGPLADARVRRWADIDHNGRADQILVTAGGGARAWLNEGISQNLDGTLKVKLHDIGAILEDSGLPPKDLQLVDVGGDGSADLVRTGWTGVTHIWLNRLGLKPAATTDGPIRDLSQDRRWEDHGVSFDQGLGEGNSYRWGDVNQDGKDELFVIGPDQGWTFYWNNGKADTGWNGWTKGVSRAARQPGLVGNQLRIADIDGDGEPDCVTVDRTGQLTDVLVWDDSKPAGEKLCGRPMTVDVLVPEIGPLEPNTQIIFAEIDGAPGDDYLLVEPRGTTRLWLNHFPEAIANGGRALRWQGVHQIAGPLAEARIRRWADLDGDGLADQILLTPDGGARAWLNKGLKMSEVFVGPDGVELDDIGEIASDKDVPAAEVQFVDVGGDGRADLVRTGHTGVTHVWLNRLTDQDLR